MTTWMGELASHYEKIRQKYPQDKLMLVFDIDGTILDMRYLVLNVLRAFDLAHDTQYFQKLEVSVITTHENHLEQLLAQLEISPEEQKPIIDWYIEQRWSLPAIQGTYHPFQGVLEVIRWFQIQPNTYVGLNTGRPDKMRSETLRMLNNLGQAHQVEFSNELCHMNHSNEWEKIVHNSKVMGIQHFLDAGYRVCAAIDNEPGDLRAIADKVATKDMLLFHANTIFESEWNQLPKHVVSGNEYDLTDLISEKNLPTDIQYVWHGINDQANLRQFLASDIQWGECDIHWDPESGKLVLHHDPLGGNSIYDEMGELSLTLEELLHQLCKAGKSVKLDLKGGGELVGKTLDMLDEFYFDDSQLWLNSGINHLAEDGFRMLADAHPNAIVQCAIDHLEHLICSEPLKAKELIDTMASWGINRYSIKWQLGKLQTVFDQMQSWGFEVNIYGMDDLETFLQAVLWMPRSVTADFNFPKWHHYGRGSGQGGTHYEYSMHKKTRDRR